MAKAKPEDGGPVVIKKYANRRLYNTASSSYVTLDDLCAMVKSGADFVVYDAKTGEDITRPVLTQIIFEQETKGENLLPISFLKQLIGFYDDSLRSVVPSYLEVAMENFGRNQEAMRQHIQDTFGEIFPVQQMQDVARQNMEMFRQAMSVFVPGQATGQTHEPRNGAAEGTETGSGKRDQEIEDLKDQLDRMQRQIDTFSRGR